MKDIFLKRFSLIIFLSSTFWSYAMSQDTTTTKENIKEVLTNNETVWYMQPWVWIVGGIAILLLLIAMFSGGRKRDKATSRTDKVIITKTVRTETDVDE
ncbi:MAG: hypothetical protein ABIY51_11005 [Ferruginibacter sp.]